MTFRLFYNSLFSDMFYMFENNVVTRFPFQKIRWEQTTDLNQCKIFLKNVNYFEGGGRGHVYL